MTPGTSRRERRLRCREHPATPAAQSPPAIHDHRAARIKARAPLTARPACLVKGSPHDQGETDSSCSADEPRDPRALKASLRPLRRSQLVARQRGSMPPRASAPRKRGRHRLGRLQGREQQVHAEPVHERVADHLGALPGVGTGHREPPRRVRRRRNRGRRHSGLRNPSLRHSSLGVPESTRMGGYRQPSATSSFRRGMGTLPA
jgi:hypothetical protein